MKKVMGLAVFWNEASHSAVAFEGLASGGIVIKQVDDPQLQAFVRSLVSDYSKRNSEFAKAARDAAQYAMPSRKKQAEREAKAALLIKKMREVGYTLAKPGSLEYAYAVCMFDGLI